MIRLLTLHNFPDVELHVQVWIFTVVAQLDQGDRHHEPPPHTSTRHVSNVWPCCAILDTWNQEACQLRFDEDNLFEHPFIITLLKCTCLLFLQGESTKNGSLLRYCHVMSNIDYRSASNTHLLIYIFLKTLVVKGIRKGLWVIFIYLFYFDLACVGYFYLFWSSICSIFLSIESCEKVPQENSMMMEERWKKDSLSSPLSVTFSHPFLK